MSNAFKPFTASEITDAQCLAVLRLPAPYSDRDRAAVAADFNGTPEAFPERFTPAPAPHFPHLSFDGCGINGRDEYRTRLATFAKVRSPEAREFGPLFAASPDMLAVLVSISQDLADLGEIHSETLRQIPLVIARARGKV